MIAGHVRGRSSVSLTRLGLAAWISVPLAALACSVELAFSGAAAFSASAPAMLGIHAAIGASEALITVLAFSLFSAPVPASQQRAWAPALSALLFALILSPFASGNPDGLEWVAAKVGFWHESAPAFVAPLADYSLSGSLPAGLSTGLAGMLGTLVVFAAGCAFSLAWIPPRPRRIS
jgi:cobalt/nickel transport system permease protein